jgi:hypothetical protein
MAVHPDKRFTAAQLRDLVKVTERQIDEWCRKDTLRHEPPSPTNGKRRMFSNLDARVAYCLGQLDKGKCPPDLMRSVANLLYNKLPSIDEPRYLAVIPNGQVRIVEWSADTGARFMWHSYIHEPTFRY